MMSTTPTITKARDATHHQIMVGRRLSRIDSTSDNLLLAYSAPLYALRRRRITKPIASNPARINDPPTDNSAPLCATFAEPPNPVDGADVGTLAGGILVDEGLVATTTGAIVVVVTGTVVVVVGAGADVVDGGVSGGVTGVVT
jgi:hypothetical protein